MNESIKLYDFWYLWYELVKSTMVLTSSLYVNSCSPEGATKLTTFCPL